ncbi:MAG: PEP/pyruvate-binding domain-containing protein [bacterium]|nr:PEP/pyruvate-binding domain-containing protein [bacterium]
MNKYTVPLSQISVKDISLVGGKGGNLGELARAGFPVPDGFCIRMIAFEDFLDQNLLPAKINGILGRIDFTDLSDLEVKTQAIRELVSAAPVPPEIRDEIQSAYRSLGRADQLPLVAVRSSVGTKDLSRSSFPGQMDTYYGVKGEDELIQQVVKCWASLFTSRATLARHKLSLDHSAVFIAPVVQMMVPADAAGVVFTAHPLSGRTEEMLINASFGLGESVVSGKVRPDQIAVQKSDLAIKSEEIGEKPIKIVLDLEKGRGSKEIPVEEKLRREPCLSRDQIRKLAGICLEIESHYGQPQDIEWARVGEELFILQSRRIAAVKKEKPEEEKLPAEWVSEFDTPIDPRFAEYTSANISEVVPGVLTPFTLSGMIGLETGWRLPNLELGLFELPPNPPTYIFIGFFYGRAHLNITTFRKMTAQIPGASAAEFDRPIPGIGKEAPREPWWKEVRKYLRLPGFIYREIRFERAVPGRARRWRDEVFARIAEEKKQNIHEIPLAEIAGRMEAARDEGAQVLGVHIAASQLAVAYFEALRKLTARWLGDEYGALAARLVTGLNNLESARPSFEIYKLSREVMNSSELKTLFTSSHAREIGEKLQGESSESASRFREKLKQFLDRYGFRSVSEAEVIYPSWDEDPSYVFEMIQNYLGIEPGQDPSGIEERQRLDREKAVREVESRLHVWQKPIFHKILKGCHTFIPLREEMKGAAMMGANTVKKVCRIFSRHLREKGIIGNEEDIYFLKMDEILPLIRGETPPPDLAERIRRRREEYRMNQEVELPESFRGRPVPRLKSTHSVQRTGRVLTGIPVSPGKVTGKARVILTPRAEARIKPGEILVAPVTDAAWTPLFLVARGLVVDVGGLLSHGSIVAREYGIPGVINVKDATRIIRDGEMITVDGDRGEVILSD